MNLLRIEPIMGDGGGELSSKFWSMIYTFSESLNWSEKFNTLDKNKKLVAMFQIKTLNSYVADFTYSLRIFVKS